MECLNNKEKSWFEKAILENLFYGVSAAEKIPKD